MTTTQLASGDILRLAKARKGISPFPQPSTLEDFEPSSEDKASAGAHDGHVLISVWDCARTSVPQVLALRGQEGIDHPAFGLSIEAVMEVRVHGREALYVARDPLPEPQRFLPGADGHCGLGDLARGTGEPRAVIREICSRLVDLAVILP